MKKIVVIKFDIVNFIKLIIKILIMIAFFYILYKSNV